jgi:hypothetical protein
MGLLGTSSIECFGLVSDKKVYEALQLTEAFATLEHREITFISALARITLDSPAPLKDSLLLILKTNGWLENQQRFPPTKGETFDLEWGRRLLSGLYDFLFSRSEFLETLGRGFHTLGACIRERTKANSEDPPEFYCPDGEINAILERSELGIDEQPVKNDILQLLENSSILSMLKIKEIIVEKLLFLDSLWLDEHAIQLRDLVQHLQAITLVKLPRTGIIDEIRRELVHAYAVDRLCWDDEGAKAKAEFFLDFDLFAQLIGLLKLQQHEPWLRSFLKQMRGLSSLTDFRALTQLLKEISGLELDQKSFIWRNPKFQYLVMAGLVDPGVLEELILGECEGGTVPPPPYIPSQISAVLKSSLLRNEVTPAAWKETWEGVEDTLLIFQSILVIGTVPEKFAKVSRANIASNALLRSNLLAAGALFYWNLEQSYFEEPWTLVTINSAVERIMSWQDSASNQETPVDIWNSKISMTIEEGTSDSLLSLIRQLSPKVVKQCLRLQTSLKANVSMLNRLWNNDPVYKTIIAHFASILLLEKPECQTELQRLEIGIQNVGQTTRKGLHSFALHIHAKLGTLLEEESEDESEIQKHNALLRQVQSNLNYYTLELKHFVRELIVIHEIDREHGIKDPTLQVLLARFYSGNALELFNPFGRSLNPLAITGLPALVLDMKIFVLSLVGMPLTAKACLFETLFPKSGRNVFEGISRHPGVLGPEGISFRLHGLEIGLSAELGVDGILILDTEDIATLCPELQAFKSPGQAIQERKMTVLAMLLSDLTIFNFRKSSSLPITLSNLLQISLIGATRSTSTNSLDFLLVQHESTSESTNETTPLAEEITSLVKVTNEYISGSEVELGSWVSSEAILFEALRRAEQEDMVFNVKTIGMEQDLPQYDPTDLELLKKEIQRTCQSRRDINEPMKLKEWFKKVKATWRNLNASAAFPCQHNTIDEVKKSNSKLIALGEVKHRIETCFLRHGVECKKLLLKLRPKDSAAVPDMNLLWNLLSGIPSACTSGDSNEQCEDCKALTTEIEGFLSMHPSEDDVVRFYRLRSLQSIWAKLRQHSTSLDITLKSGMTNVFEELFAQQYEASKKYTELEIQNFLVKLFLSMRQSYSETTVVESSWREMCAEVEDEYFRVPAVVEGFIAGTITGGSPPDFELDFGGIPKGLALKIKMQNLPRYILEEYRRKDASIYFEFGMIRKLKRRIQKELDTFQAEFGNLTRELGWGIHLFVLFVFSTIVREHEEAWLKECAPLQVLNAVVASASIEKVFNLASHDIQFKSS